MYTEYLFQDEDNVAVSLVEPENDFSRPSTSQSQTEAASDSTPVTR